MIIRLPKTSAPVRLLLQRAGYAEVHDRRSGQISYTRRLGSNSYPRFHVYAEDAVTGARINLHLDQKQPSYAGQTKHSGEYDGPVVEAEGERLQRTFGLA